jgi:hypothetical protein
MKSDSAKKQDEIEGLRLEMKADARVEKEEIRSELTPTGVMIR